MKSLVTEEKAMLYPFLRKIEKITNQNTNNQPHLCAREDHRTDPPGGYAKAHSKFCLAKLVAFYDGITASTNKEESLISSLWTSLRPLPWSSTTSSSPNWKDEFDELTSQ